jgi:hypothetical protein
LYLRIMPTGRDCIFYLNSVCFCNPSHPECTGCLFSSNTKDGIAFVDSFLTTVIASGEVKLV